MAVTLIGSGECLNKRRKAKGLEFDIALKYHSGDFSVVGARQIQNSEICLHVSKLIDKLIIYE